MEYHKQKAIDKGAEIKNDTVYKPILQTDTIHDTLTNTIRIETKVVDSIPFEVTTLKYVRLSRQERKRFRDSLKYERKMKELQNDSLQALLKHERVINRQNNRNDVKTQKNEIKLEKSKRYPWYIWFMIGFGTAFILISLKKIIDFFKNLTRPMP